MQASFGRSRKIKRERPVKKKVKVKDEVLQSYTGDFGNSNVAEVPDILTVDHSRPTDPVRAAAVSYAEQQMGVSLQEHPLPMKIERSNDNSQPVPMSVDTFESYVPGPEDKRITERIRRAKQKREIIDENQLKLPDNEQLFGYVDGILKRNQKMTTWCVEVGLDIPEPPPVPRAYMQQCYEEPDVKKGERLCLKDENCISYKHHGFTLKEFLNPDRYAVIQEEVDTARSQGQQASLAYMNAVSQFPRNTCIWCELAETTKKYFCMHNGIRYTPFGYGDQQEEEAQTLSSAAEEQPIATVHIIQTIQNLVNEPGEYDEKYTLVGDSTYKGIIAPVLRFDPTFWVVSKCPDGRRGYQERAELGFREGAVSSTFDAYTTCPSNHTGHASSDITSLQ